MIQGYFDQIKAWVDRFATTPFVLYTHLQFEARQGDQGYVTGVLTFADGSQLHFREYVDGTRGTTDPTPQIEKLAYSYHYQDSAQRMIFRYDNAAHKPSLSAPEHKHIDSEIIAASAPTLEDVLMEIAQLCGWV